MKKTFFIFLINLMSSLSAGSQTIGEAFYIYRNDGHFNAFFREEVDSMTYSCYDADSILHNDVVTQVVYTQDSIYRIPLVAIDSVGFVTPEREFQPDVMCMDKTWLPYVIRLSENSIIFSPSTPSSLLPRKGQVVVAETFEPPFETGFSGRVTLMDTYPDSIVCIVEEVLLSDIYRRLVAVGMSYSEGTDENAAYAPRRIFDKNTNPGVKFPLPPITDLTIGPVIISCTPTVILKYIVCLWEQNLKDYVEMWCDQTYEGSVSINAQLEKDYTPEPKWEGSGINVPTNVPGLYGRVQVGGFFRSTGSVQLSATKEFYRKGKSGFVYSEDKGFKGINEWNKPSEEDWETSVSIDGSISAGLAGRLQFGIGHEKLASADITLYVGPEISGHAEVNVTDLVADNNLYSSIKDSEITLSIIADVVPGYYLIGFKSSKVMPEPPSYKDIPVTLKFTWPINHWYLVPEFDNLKWQADANGGDLSGDIRRNLLSKVSLGWALYDKYNNLYKSEYFTEKYRKAENWPYQGLAYHFEDIQKNTKYRAYPMVKLMGVEMRTDKGVEVCVRECPVTLSDFTVTKKQYEKGAFTHDGKTYDYRFDVSVTATLNDDAADISDWGYVYLDTNGQEAFISLKQFGHSRTDDRWAYFRSGTPPFTCTLYGYVKFVGSDEIVYGEPHDYPLEYGETTCPDSNHPHAIDLGLPSGTKWCCCNVGANTPEGYGGYYAWGETNEKNWYSKKTYLYATIYSLPVSNSEYEDGTYYTANNIGNSISGTLYDAARINWGSPWRMPTHDEQMELLKNCISEIVIVNEVYGCKFTSKNNGNSIFLPAAGGYYNDGIYNQGQRGYYWSGTLYLDNEWGAHDLRFRDGEPSCYYFNRARGHSIRPVLE